jgi:histidinol-phosphate aminotransferase
MVNQEALDRFMDRLPDHVVAVLDEAYYEFLDDAPDTVKYVREGRNVCVLRTFSKAYGLAGLRIGYGLASPQVSAILQKARQPFNANSMAQAAALAAMNDSEHVAKTMEVNRTGLAFYEQAFAARDLEYVPSAANFVLVKVGDGDDLFAKMLRKGVIVRAMSGYKLPEWVRISIGTMPENERCIEVLDEVLGCKA